MNGEKYYTFKPERASVRFFALDSNYMDKAQLAWVEKELSSSDSEWKIAFFHHPLYSGGRHGSDVELRQVLEPLFVKHGLHSSTCSRETASAPATQRKPAGSYARATRTITGRTSSCISSLPCSTITAASGCLVVA
jgi:hypothetical protein